MRIALCEFHQETNSFNPVKTTYEDYVKVGIYEGASMDKFRGGTNAMSGKYAAIEEAGGAEIIPILSMTAQSGGTAEHEVVDIFLRKVLSGLKKSLPLDGVFLGLHGATQSDTSDDVCGDILEAVRSAVGRDCVIAASTDLHANVTEKWTRNADFITGYHTYPHVDFFETGYRAAKLGIMKIKGNNDLKMVRAFVPMIAPASSYTTMHGPFREIMQFGLDLVKSGELTDFSVYQMQPWLDVSCAQSSVLAISPDSGKARQYADRLAKMLFDARGSFVQKLYQVDDVISRAEQNRSGEPYILVDSSDSPNAGATGDSAELIRAIQSRKSDVKAAVYLNDIPAVRQAFELGVNGEAVFTIGASLDKKASQPVTLRGRVLSLHDGYYTQEGPAQRGKLNNIGKTAVIRYRNTDMILCGNILGPGDPQLYRHFGIEPTFYQLVSVKACTSWRAAYESMAGEIFETDMPGNAPLNLFHAHFTRLPKHFYPFEDITEEDIRRTE